MINESKLVFSEIYRSPNHDPYPIDVEFIVLHYTGGTFQRAIDLFMDPTTQVSTHLLIAPDGKIFELVPCWKGEVYKAWHAGVSQWTDNSQVWENLNQHAIGIEIVNPNGNIIPYTDQQYMALTHVLRHLMIFYPALRSPSRIIGHEHIAGWRGKADPGRFFDWERFFRMCYPDTQHPDRKYICPLELQNVLMKFLPIIPSSNNDIDIFWNAINAMLETSLHLLYTARQKDIQD